MSRNFPASENAGCVFKQFFCGFSEHYFVDFSYTDDLQLLHCMHSASRYSLAAAVEILIICDAITAFEQSSVSYFWVRGCIQADDTFHKNEFLEYLKSFGCRFWPFLLYFHNLNRVESKRRIFGTCSVAYALSTAKLIKRRWLTCRFVYLTIFTVMMWHLHTFWLKVTHILFIEVYLFCFLYLFEMAMMSLLLGESLTKFFVPRL